MAPRRIKRNKLQENLYKELTNKNEFGIFDTYKDVFMTAGLIGFLEGKREHFEEAAEGIAWSVFNLETDLALFNAVALYETKDPKILINDDDEIFDKKATIFEEYASGGLPILYEKVMEYKRSASENYFDLIMEMENKKPELERTYDDIMDNLSQF